MLLMLISYNTYKADKEDFIFLVSLMLVAICFQKESPLGLATESAHPGKFRKISSVMYN
jgi:hypothetical protein